MTKQGAHLKHLNRTLLGVVEDVADISRDRGARRELDARIEHHQGFPELGIVDDEIGTVATRAPHREEESKTRIRVRHPRGISGDHLSLWGVLGIAGLDVPSKVARTFLELHPVDVFRRMSR